MTDAPAAPAPSDASVGMGLRLAYLVNLYPAVSHTFIRREILALERLGATVLRCAIRGWQGELADPQDRAERSRTRYALRDGLPGLLAAVLVAALRSPRRFGRAFALALSLGRQAFRPMPYHLAFLAEACRLLPWVRTAGIDHVHAHFGSNSTEVALLLHALGGPPFSFTVHGPTEFDQPERHKLRDKAAHAAFVVAISSFGRSQLYRWLRHEDWHKVKVVHCGLDADFHTGHATDPPAAARLVCVGRLCHAKGQLLLVEAAAQVVAAGRPLELVLAGDGEIRPQLEALIASLGLDSHVRITGWLSSAQVRSEIVNARALVLPSFAEGLPVVIMEAMALGRPVVTSHVAGIPELVRANETGWLFPAGDIAEIVAAMNAALDAAPEQLARMGAAARTRVAARHDVDREAAKLLAHIRSGGAAASP